MVRSGGTLARVLGVLGILAAAGVALLLLAPWGHIHTFAFSTDNGPLVTASRTFSGGDLRSGFAVALIALFGAVAAVGLVAILRPLRYPLVLLIACVAMIADVVLIAVEWNHTGQPFGAIITQPNVVRVDWRWSSSTPVIGLALGGIGACVWLGLSLPAAAGKRCPDCAERVWRSAVDCPHCGYEFAMPRGQKRCEACHQPVKAEARVCWHCHHRVGDPVEQAAGS